MDSLIGKTVDNYRILEVIGRGGMGVVFKALDTSLEKIVALKMIDPFLARDENFVRRFKTEAKALAKLENQNIVGVYALRETESGFFMVMEYVESKPLSQYLQENGPFNIKDTVSITKQLLNAIGHAHKVGVIHRDIKPSNILLCDNGKIKVTDFGLAKVVEAKGPASTVTQARAGTLYYMSPEQVKGLKNVDSKSDIYSLGISVYEMIAGRVPFDKTDSDFTIQKKIVDGEIPSPVKFNSTIPKKLTKIISKSIDKDPAKRYQSCDEMYADLEEFEAEISEEKKKLGKSTAKVKTGSEKTSYKPGFKIDFKNPVFLISSVAVLIVLVILFIILSPGGEPVNEAFISISTTPPGSEIFINDKSIGKSPIEEFKIESAKHITLKISKDGFDPLDTTLNIKSGEKENLAFKLNPIRKEQINITTNPPDAKLIVNNNLAGISPLANYTVSPGVNKIRIEKVGYLLVDTMIRVNKDLANTFNFNLTKDPNFKGFGTLKITSEPIEALVLLNGEFVGKTPFENKELAVADYKLILRKNGYNDYSESIRITLNKTKTIAKQLTSSSNTTGEQFGKIKVTTKPSEATVYLDGEFVGSTPYVNDKIPVGTHNLLIKKKGFSEISETVSINLDRLTPVSKNLESSQNLETVKGKVEILVRPYGSIYIDDELKAQDTNSPYTTELSGGKHTIKLVHPTLGKASIPINIVDEKLQKYIFDLSRVVKLTIVSNPPNCEILINGESKGNTPTRMNLKAGSYKIVLKKDGYKPSNEVKYDVSASIYQESADREDRREFTLSKIQ
jgi:eukaryotic-like serine/threonine-protein kinase